MSRKSRDKGAAWERAVANWLKTHGFPNAARRGVGYSDYDIIGVPGVAIECKNAETLSVPAWWRQTLEQADAATPLLIMKRKGHADPGDAMCVMSLSDLAELLGGHQ